MIWVSAVIVFGVLGWYFKLLNWRSRAKPIGMRYLIHTRSPLPLMVPIIGGLLLGILALIQDLNWWSLVIVGLEVAGLGLVVIGATLMSRLPENTSKICVGDFMPGYSLSDQDGVLVSLEPGGPRPPVLYVFYRGHW